MMGKLYMVFLLSLLSQTYSETTTSSPVHLPSNAETRHQETNVPTEIPADSCKVKLSSYTGETKIRPRIEKSSMALLLLLGFGGFSLLIAGGYRALRKYVYRDEHNLDTVFDAGGRVSVSLTAVTVTSQLLWPADFLQSETLTSKSGLGGSLWMSIGIFVDILLFPALSLYLKTRAPGAKTFPQIAYARFGKMAHIIFCFIALLTNVIVSMTVMLAGKTTIQVLSKDSNNTFIYLLIAVLFGSYCMIGGLGTTFYISYFNTALTFLSVSVYILYTSFYPSSDIKDISLVDRMYEHVICLQGPDGNYENSFLTFRTRSGLIYGIVLLFMATSISFCDQANWQSRIAAKPSQGVIGYFLAAYLWFVVPATLSFTATMSYMSMSALNGTHLLSEAEIDNGYITPFIMGELLGDTGAYLFLTMLMMALMSTGSGEVMAISSIIVYDIYKTHVNPFRKNHTQTSCILCGKEKLIYHKDDQNLDDCNCPSSIDCGWCKDDLAARLSSREKTFEIHYKCSIHGKYRHYEDGLMRYKTWCMVWIVIGVVPLGLILSETSINVNWTTLGMQVFTSPFLVPLFLTISWSKATAQGVVSGSILGLACSIAAMLIGGSMYEGGLDNFFVNTVKDYPLLSAMLSGFISSGVITVIVSLCTHQIRSKDDEEREWAKTINIDNPLNPFRLVYEEELKEVDAGPIITSDTMDRIFRKAKIVAVVGGTLSLILFLIVIPSIVLSIEVLTLEQFQIWIRTFQYWCFGATILVVFLPPVEEVMQIRNKLRQNRAESKSSREM
uniref:DUR3-like urea-proton symporter n=1 Tax=Tridacna squamosa TaxID=80830 RepID=A0A2R2Z1X0_TRISQ|nr:DUR3-like urea-proton symporter [Tridacna squamosa]